MRKERQPKKLRLTPIVFCVVILLVLAQLIISHSLATQGEKLRRLEQEAEELEQENLISTEEIDTAGSLSRIAQEAKKLGLVRANQVLHLTPQIPVALGR